MLSDINVKGTNHKIGGDIADGQWVNVGLNVFKDVSYSTTGERTYTVSNYLPDDNHIYEVMVGCFAYTGTTSGDMCNWWVRDANGDFSQTMGYCRTRSSSNVQNGNEGVLPMRQINGDLTFSVNVVNAGGGTGGNGLYLQGYRRLGGELPPLTNKTLTINPTPADATVTFDKGTVVGNTCTVVEGTRVTVTVSKTGYQTKTQIYTVADDMTESITLVAGIPMYGYKYTSGGNTAYLFMIGGMTASFYGMYAGTASHPEYTITEITGTIGASGSTVNGYSYNRTLNVNGVNLYCYTKTVLGVTTELGVLQGAVVGDKYIGGQQFTKPNSASSSQVVWGSYTYSRKSSTDFTFIGS